MGRPALGRASSVPAVHPLEAPVVAPAPEQPLTSEPPMADAEPLISEPPMADVIPLTSEPPMADVIPLTSEPTPVAAAAVGF
ncbi:hypothetical protein ACFYM2_22415 [Streptomyces sp. NPDC006711]|uniref:hypothetical protein n=1 Tax=Streptomyces sp. NPDC006711 TaxID=3364762 RepID=UPI0036BDB2FF